MQQRLIIPQELKSPTKVSSKLYLSDFIFIIVYFMCFLILDVFVDSRLHVVYYIFNIFIALILTRKSIYNPPKRIYQTLLYMIIKDRTVYHPISPPEVNKMQGELIGNLIENEKPMYQKIAETPRK